ncbi:MAG: VanZ family protein [Bacilli bacterium]|nr:VanZ family protein [Bacilli bacterium]MDD4406747.1 VanZ family protein [Bacilli bacterium]
MIPKIAVDVVYELWPMLILFCIVLITLRVFYLKNYQKPFILYKELISLCFLIYILLLFELVTSTDFNSYSNNFIPFKEIFRYDLTSPLFYRNVLGNVLLLLPFGYFTSYYVKVNKYYINFIITFVTSFSIEFIQSNIGRSFDIDDIILNMIGGYLGYLLYKISSKLMVKYSVKIKNNILINIISIIVILVLIYIILSIYGVRL